MGQGIADAPRCTCCDGELIGVRGWGRLCADCKAAVDDFMRIRRINLHNPRWARIKVTP